MAKFEKQYVMIDGVKGFSKFNEDGQIVFAFVNVNKPFIGSIQKSCLSGMILSKAWLKFLKRIFEKIWKLIMNKFFEGSGYHRKNRYWPVIVRVRLGALSFVDGAYTGNFQIVWINA